MAAGVSDDVTRVARVMPGDLDTDTSLLSGPRSVTVRSTTGGAGQTFELEHQLDGSASQQAVWEEIGGQELLVDHLLLKGHSAAILAVGPSGGGKSHTLTGQPDDPGISLRVLRALLEQRTHRSLRVEVCALEVVGDAAYDLLSPSTERRAPLTLVCGDGHPTVWYAREGEGEGAESVGADCWYAVEGLAQAEALRVMADWRRRTRPTARHARSARGHSLFFVRLSRPPDSGPGAGGAPGAGGSPAPSPGATASPQGWQCRLCCAQLAGLDRVEGFGAQGLSPPSLREVLGVGASVSALLGVVRRLSQPQPQPPYTGPQPQEMGDATAATAQEEQPQHSIQERGAGAVWRGGLAQLLRESLCGARLTVPTLDAHTRRPHPSPSPPPILPLTEPPLPLTSGACGAEARCGARRRSSRSAAPRHLRARPPLARRRARCAAVGGGGGGAAGGRLEGARATVRGARAGGGAMGAQAAHRHRARSTAGARLARRWRLCPGGA